MAKLKVLVSLNSADGDIDLAAAPLTITGTLAGQTTVSEAPIQPFSGVTIGDPNGATDTLTITLSGTGGTLTGSGLSGGTDGVYTLTGTAAAITSALDALSFTPLGVPNKSVDTRFTLNDTSSAFATPTQNMSTLVTDTDPATAAAMTSALETPTTLTVDPGQVTLNGVTAASVAEQADALRFMIGSNMQTDTVAGFATSDPYGVLDLKNGAGGYASVNAIVQALHSDGHGGAMLALGTSGSIDFLNTSASQLAASHFAAGR